MGRLFAVEVHIARDVEIELAVAVVVAPRRAWRPVAQRHFRLLRHIGKRSIVIVVVEPILAVVADVQIRPAIVVIVRNRAAIAPAVVLNAGLFRDIGECPVVIVAEQRGMRRRLFPVESVEGRAIHQVDVEPAIVVVVDQADARAVRLHDELLLRHAHLVDPAGQTRSLAVILEDHRAPVDKSARRDRAFLRVVLRRGLHAGRDAAAHSRLRVSVEVDLGAPGNSCCRSQSEQPTHNTTRPRTRKDTTPSTVEVYRIEGVPNRMGWKSRRSCVEQHPASLRSASIR